jgi:hypothetical protein
MTRSLLPLTAAAFLASVALGHAEPPPAACLAATDLAAVSPALGRVFQVIDTTHRGCVTGREINLYRAAVRDDRRGAAGRIAAHLAQFLAAETH